MRIVLVASLAALTGCAALIGIEETELGDGPAPDAAFAPCDNPTIGTGETEPNNSTASAQQVIFLPQTLSDLAICPTNDVDVFRVEVSGSLSSLSGEIQLGGDPLRLELLDSGGVALSTSTPGMDNPNSVRVEVTMPPNGEYFFRVSPLGPGDIEYTLMLSAFQ